MMKRACKVEILFEDEDLVDQERIKEMLRTAIVETIHIVSGPIQASVTLLVAGDETLHRLNREFLEEDRATDVLSFPAGESMPGMNEMATYLGDIVLSAPYASRQAGNAGHGVMDELQLLAVHGTLHLLGYDHGTSEEKKRMWAEQTAVLDKLGLANVTATEK